GISSGASVGAVGAIVLGWSIPGLTSTASISILAFIGALTSLVLVLLLATDKSGALPPERTILSGIAVAQIAAAFTTVVVMVFADKDGMRSVSVWTLGSFTGVRIPDGLFVVAVAVICVLALVPAARILDAFAFGETTAQTLGVNVVKARWLLLVGCALATAATVAAVGPIGFVGLMIPHGVRLLVGPQHRALLPLSALAGGLLMVWADTAARSIVPGREIPIGVVTSALGAPVLVFLLRWRGRSR
ncbi:MAG: FecCD family ABC transporter permease, partial [Propionibacteriaceae bacterium]